MTKRILTGHVVKSDKSNKTIVVEVKESLDTLFLEK